MNTRRRQTPVSKNAARARAAAAKDAVSTVTVDAMSAPVVEPTAPSVPAAPRATAAKRESSEPKPVQRPAERWLRQGCKLTEAEYGALSALKKRASELARPMKRSELLRVGLQALARLDDAALFDELDRSSLARR
ncbi:hypothetical protein [Lysobacter claricitrinus]|uniref:hypothetical protein n=1 Tax=Lysobacter claricitrinus TaxID=3367728 RepID=UPI0037DB5345